MDWLRNWRRRRVLARERIDEALWRRAKKRLPFLAGLSPEEERRLREMTVIFLAEKEFTPVRGVALSDADRVEIAAQACLLVLELGLEAYDDWVGIVVHPSDFRVRRARTDEAGVVHEWDDELAGESWPGGPVVLSWEALGEAGSVAEGGANVVIHEFAHKLDMMDGEADGVPPLAGRAAREKWIETFDAEFARFREAVDAGRETLLDPYAAEDEAEFFAVASEAFFETPNALKREHPALYALLAGFYRQDPARRLAA
ncbi:MAG: zinc-dependent peptidase [Burkholderiales bacterium]|nr:zinc-dependent peptidase [Burkholderiales bacterium]